ncbi:hypothetical protein AB0B57_27365 [Micromonospora sp. NPDC049101]|uniref:hypothetical protein n=1 Tax=Micromonospora sp. NPDC049101 TaxID=3155032 RepID=UPI0033F175AB
MAAHPGHTAPRPAVTTASQPPSSLDYYLVLPRPGDPDPATAVGGLVVEEFTREHDQVSTGLDSAGWTPATGWWSSASLSRGIRTDPATLARVVPTSRAQAEGHYRRLGGGQLPDEAVLRSYFLAHQPIPTAAPLRLGPDQPPAGYRERRVYRVLFAKDLHPDQVTSLRASWRTPVDATSTSAASGHLETNVDRFSWELRRVGHTRAWALDVIVLLGTAADDVVGSALSDLTRVLRQHGLIPVTTERFS